MFGHRFGRQEVSGGSLRELDQVLGQLVLRPAPREVRVRLIEADLGQTLHHPRTRERLRRATGRRGDRRFTSASSHSQNPKGFVCGLSTRKIETLSIDPEQHDIQERAPEPLPILRLEIDRVDVLVRLRRVLREADRAVGAMAEPLGMLRDPRVIGRALEREVEGELHLVALQLRQQVLEVVERPELRMDRGVPTGLRSDRPRAPRIVGSGRRGVVRALPAWCRPIGWIGGRYSTSNPSSAMSGTSAATSRSVPCRPGSGDAERGKSSYQAPWRARSRAATITSSCEAAAPRRRSGARTSAHGGRRTGRASSPRRASAGRMTAAAALSRSASSSAPAARARRTAPPTSAAPSFSSTATSWPAVTALLEVRAPRRPRIDPALDAEAVRAALP